MNDCKTEMIIKIERIIITYFAVLFAILVPTKIKSAKIRRVKIFPVDSLVSRPASESFFIAHDDTFGVFSPIKSNIFWTNSRISTILIHPNSFIFEVSILFKFNYV